MTDEERREIIRKLDVRESRFYDYVKSHPSEDKLFEDWLCQYDLPDAPSDLVLCFIRLKYFYHRMGQIQDDPSCEMWQYVHAEELNKEETNNE